MRVEWSVTGYGKIIAKNKSAKWDGRQIKKSD
jgi:hypothetical protein